MGGQVQCVAKTRFFSERSAQWKADDVNFEEDHEKLFVYKCNCCHDFHLTRTKPEDK